MEAESEGRKMKNWKTEKTLYEVHETTNRKDEKYHMVMTGEEMTKWCKMKNEAYGYIESCGGDKSYSCWAVVLNY